MIKPALVVSDLDGTLLKPNTSALEPRVLNAIQHLIDAGIPFMPASGRQYPNVHGLFGHLADQLSYVCENGVVAFVDGKLAYHATLDHALGQEMVRAIQQREGCEAMVSGMKTYYIDPKDPSFERYLEDDCGFVVTCTDHLTEPGEPFGKISAYYPNGIGDDLQYWQSRFGGRCAVTTSSDKWLDMMPAGVNKAAALRVVFERMGVDPADVVAFGDADNDIEMLKLVGCPIAKASGAPAAVAQALFTTDDVAEVLERIACGLPPIPYRHANS